MNPFVYGLMERYFPRPALAATRGTRLGWIGMAERGVCDQSRLRGARSGLSDGRAMDRVERHEEEPERWDGLS